MTELHAIVVTFSKPVREVVPEDLLVNNRPVTKVEGSGATYTFSFDQPDLGPIDITWDGGNGISDFENPPHFFDASDPSASWQYLLRDGTAPQIVSLVPPAGATVGRLSEVEVRFSEPVVGLDAADLLLNGSAATSVESRAANTYLFHFATAASGLVRLDWATNSGIADLSTPANPLIATNWSYQVDTNLPVARVIISEFLASAENDAGLKDEDGELQDWIELCNAGTTIADLQGWSLTDDPEDPGLWPFPAVTLAPGERLVVFASAKDRRSAMPGGRLHTNFRLNAAGEYLALFNAEAPRKAVSEFAGGYPEQRPDYSYGWDGAGWRYYQIPSPGAANGASLIRGVVLKPEVTVPAGFFEAPFVLGITNATPGVTIRYTLDGSLPTELSGTLYTVPLQVSKTTIFRAAAFAANQLPSETITCTYIFPDQVLRQPSDPPGFPIGPTVMGGSLPIMKWILKWWTTPPMQPK